MLQPSAVTPSAYSIVPPVASPAVAGDAAAVHGEHAAGFDVDAAALAAFVYACRL